MQNIQGYQLIRQNTSQFQVNKIDGNQINYYIKIVQFQMAVNSCEFQLIFSINNQCNLNNQPNQPNSTSSLQMMKQRTQIKQQFIKKKMESDQFRFISTNTFSNVGNLQQIIDSISSENELNILQQQFDQIRQRFQQRVSNTNQVPSEFWDDISNKNKKNIGVSILQNDGSFILTDNLTRKILEIKTVSEIQKRLFEYCAFAGQNKLLQQFNEENILLQQNEVQKQFQMTIYSEKIRKRTMKNLNQAAKNEKKKLENMDFRNQEKRVSHSNIQEEKFDYWEKIRIKYLKTITVKITKINMTINKEFLDSIQNSTLLYGSPQLQSMAKNPTQEYNVVKCEISVNPYVEELENDDISKDQRLQSYEEKYKVRCQEIKSEFKKIKQLKEQARFDNQFQSQCNISSELLQDLNSQIQYQWL